ncbi:MAG: septal ring lytic transglycosylase RlpA family protein [Treponema sp.]|jgi:rare lipoprotein A (peptidoglycan hydrolase)|nr:septal ring lytic transglycosylase RlpA family protein [Treponema sp.]
MKKHFSAALLFTAFVLSLGAQQREEGVAICYYGEGADILYATHKTHPFGTKLLLINPVNKSQITVQVGGRPNPALDTLIEISQAAADKLGIYRDIPTWVWLEAVPAENTGAKHVMRPRIGVFKQTGSATVLPSGTGLTASHPTLPMGVKVKVTNPANSRSVTVTISNRIRASKDRIIDMSQAAAQALGIQRTARVQIETTDG